MDKFSTWTKFSHVEIECMRLEICPLFHTAHSNLPTIHPVSQTLSVSQSSNTLTQTPKSGNHSQSLSPSNTLTQTPKSLTLIPQTLSSFLTIGFRRSLHPYLQNPFCPYQWKFRFFQFWRYVLSFVCSFIEKWGIICDVVKVPFLIKIWAF